MTLRTIAAAELEALIARALIASGTHDGNAVSVARALTQAEIDGQGGHGLSRVLGYAAQVRSGKVDGKAKASLVRTRPATALIDAANGFAYPAMDLAVQTLPTLAAETGIAAVGVRRSHHAGVIGWHVERLADRGLVALAFANTPQAMASFGGTKPVFGTNPIGFAAPRANGAPIVVDLALSGVARGKIMAAAQKDEPIPAGWALDCEGEPTTDAKAALKGTLLPVGGAKGSALALMVELLAAALMGAHFASEATSFLDADGAPPGVGQLIIAIDPTAFSAREAVLARVDALATMITDDPGARLPGTRRIQQRAVAQRDGVRVDANLCAQLEALAAS
jgi:(2R)-3-sulfolactate dehydrogenase (NADP+)